MGICQGCGSEIIGRDRFCRKCGAPVPTSVADLVDTRHLSSNAPPQAASAAGSPEFTAQFYAPPATYPQAPAYHTGSLKRKSGTWKIILLVGILMLSIFVATGIVISMQGRRNRNIPVEPPRRSFVSALHNALGIEVANLPDQDFPELKGGAFIGKLMSDESPAALAKPPIQAGDVLMELNGQAVQNAADLAQAIEAVPPNTEVPAKIFRDGKTLITSITVANPKFSPRLAEPRERDQGLLGVRNDVGNRQYIPSAKNWGVALTEPNDNGPADLAGLQRGDVITEFDGHVIRTRDELQRRIRAATPRKKVTIKFYRGSTEQTAEVLMGHR